MRKSLIAAAVVLIGVAGYLGWRYISSPQHSLLQVRKAVEQRDAARFEKYVDLEGIIRRAGNQLSAEWSAGFAKELGGFGAIEPEVINGMMAAFGSAMIEPTVKQVREAVLSFVETGRATPIQTIPGDAVDIAADLRIDSMPTIETQGKMATIDLNLSAQGEVARVRLFMRNLGSHWQIAEIDRAAQTAQDILAAYARGERKRIERERAAHPDRAVAVPGLAPGSTPLELCYIPAGKFMMGSPPNEEGRGKDEGPRHRVHLTKPFWLAKREVTNAQFEAFVKATGYITTAEKEGFGLGWDAQKKEWGVVNGITWRNPGLPMMPKGVPGGLPVVQVSWHDAMAFCKWLSETSGENFTLPTEAQWEYACRAGSTTQYWWGPSERDACQYANVFNQENKGQRGMNWDAFPCADGYVGLAPAGAFKPNAFGLHDMIGNVWEWCEDWYGETYYSTSPKEDPHGPEGGSFRVLRGGSWFRNPIRCRAASRGLNPPGLRAGDDGFRLLRTQD